MPTIKQKLAYKEITENHRSISSAMRQVGYSSNTAVKPQNLTESKGWKELCDDLGLTDELLTTALVDDIKAKPQNRKAELELGFKVRGRVTDKEEKHTQNNIFIFNDERANKIARRIVGGTSIDNQSIKE